MFLDLPVLDFCVLNVVKKIMLNSKIVDMLNIYIFCPVSLKRGKSDRVLLF